MTPATMAPAEALPRAEAETLEGMVCTAFCAFILRGECRTADFVVGGWTARQIALHGETARHKGQRLWEMGLTGAIRHV